MIGHTTPWLPLGSEEESTRQYFVSQLKKAIDVCSRLHIDLLNIHASNNNVLFCCPKRKNIILHNFVRSLRELKRYGHHHDVGLMLENTPDRHRPLSDFKHFKYLVDHSRIYVHLDVAHAFIIGGMPEVARYIRSFKGTIRHIHIHDNNGTADEHLPLGKGKIDFLAVVEGLQSINYDKTITFEVFTSMKDAAHSREMFKKMWNQ